jgi:hypothetical protein
LASAESLPDHRLDCLRIVGSELVAASPMCFLTQCLLAAIDKSIELVELGSVMLPPFTER